jgi:hypothetical protein
LAGLTTPLNNGFANARRSCFCARERVCQRSSGSGFGFGFGLAFSGCFASHALARLLSRRVLYPLAAEQRKNRTGATVEIDNAG